MTNQNIDFKEDAQQIGWLTFDLQNKKVNTLSPETMDELDKILDTIEHKKLKALVIQSHKEDSFIAGADLNVFRDIFHDRSLGEKLLKKGHAVFNKLEALPYPTIALIHGTCLGGGTELSLACSFRVGTDHLKTKIGLPEVTLGIFPGWGGTQRLPRLIQLEQALTMILTGKAISGKKAYKIGLLDKIVAAPFKEEGVREFINTIANSQGLKKIYERRKKSDLRSLILEKNPFGRALLFSLSRRNVLKKTKGHYPSPLVALDLIKKTYSMPLKKGLKEELNTFIHALPGTFAPAKHLIQLFFANESLKRQGSEQAKKITTSAVIGAGTMGAGIAFWLSNGGYDVFLKDISNEALSVGLRSVQKMYDQTVKYKKNSKEKADILFEKISPVLEIPQYKHLDIVIEAASENPEIKAKIFADLESKVPTTTILATNTSSISINEQARNLKHPERFLGMHFFNPVNRMPLVEIIKGDKTSKEAIDTAIKMCLSHNKIPIVVKDCAGFVVNRIFAPGLLEILSMLEEGIPMHLISEVLLDFGLPMDPFALADKVGNDINLHAMQTIEKAYGPRMKNPSILQSMVNKNFLGEKTGKGYFIHEGKKLKENPEIKAFIQPERKASKEEIVNRPILSMINEASRCLQEGIISSAEELDMALIYGIGFPPFRGGLLRYADEIGLDYVLKHLERFEKKQGARFTPSNMIKDLATKKRGFYNASYV